MLFLIPYMNPSKSEIAFDMAAVNVKIARALDFCDFSLVYSSLVDDNIIMYLMF